MGRFGEPREVADAALFLAEAMIILRHRRRTAGRRRLDRGVSAMNVLLTGGSGIVGINIAEGAAGSRLPGDAV